MNLLYLTFQEDEPMYSGVKNKILGQVSAFESLGFNTTYSFWKKDKFTFYGEKETEYSLSKTKMMKQFKKISSEFISENSIDTIYFRVDILSLNVLNLCKFAKKRGVKNIIIEIPNYPYIKNYMRNVLKAKGLKSRIICALKTSVNLLFNYIAGVSLKKYVNAAITYGKPIKSFWHLKTLNADNGIDLENINFIQRTQKEISEEVTIIGVTGTIWWQAYDRIIEGIKIYKQSGENEKIPIKFIMVGGDESEMPDFLRAIDENGVSDEVKCVGIKTGSDLAKEYQNSDIAASTLGCYRRGLEWCSSLKTIEYCAVGIPFIYAYNEQLLNEEIPFALKSPNDSSPIDIKKVVDFVVLCRKNPTLALEERKFAEENYDWKIIMKKILAFANNNIKD